MANIVGTAGNDIRTGTGADDTFTLLGGDDTVNSQGGADTIIGGAGFDTINYIFSTNSVVLDIGLEFGLGGFAQDNRWNSIERFGGSAFDDSFIGGENNVEVDGLTGNDVFKGAGGRETFNGGPGADTISYEDADAAVTMTVTNGTRGDALADEYSRVEKFIGSDFDDFLNMATIIPEPYADFWTGNFEYYGGAGNDLISGNETNELAYGGDGNDAFSGSLGADSFFGGDGKDTVNYSFSNEAIVVHLLNGGQNGIAEGDAYAGIENVNGGNFDDRIDGSLVNNVLNGNGGNDFIVGGLGNDSLFGGLGNDILNGGSGRDVLGGGLGADTMYGGDDNDIYIVDNVSDSVLETSTFSQGGGIDTVRTFIDYVQPNNVELVRLGFLNQTSDLNATGNDAPGTLVGNAGNNLLIGRGGDDQLNGNDGDDRIIGNTGRDTMVGGAGADTFVYSSISESRAGAANRDFINGFDRGSDQIDLSAIDANLLAAGNQSFEFIGTRGFDADGAASAGQLRLQGVGGPNAVLVEGDLRGDGVIDFQVFVNLTTVLSASDFIL